MAKYEIKDGVGIIPEGTTEISDNAFRCCDELTSVTIPNSVTKIGNCAFVRCTGLTSIVIPDSVTEIGPGAFCGCSGLTCVKLPHGLEEISGHPRLGGVFTNCSSLTNITIPDSVTKINDFAFAGCTALKDITIPKSVVEIGKSAFAGTGLTSVVIPSSVEVLSNNPFFECPNLVEVKVESGNKTYDSRDNCNAIIHTESNTLFAGFASTVIPKTVVAIEKDAFEGVLNYTNLDIPSSVKMIGDFAFFCTGLKNVMIPAGITEIGLGVFGSCAELESLNVAQDNKTFDSRGNCNAIIETESNKLIAGCSNTTIPDSVTEIGNRAFFSCPGLTSITIPDSVTVIGDAAFAKCENLASVVIPDTVTNLSDSAFLGCKALRSVTLPSSLAKIFLNNWCEDVRPKIIKTGGEDSLQKLANKIKKLLQKKKIKSLGAENENDDFFDWGRIALFECGDHSRMVFLKEIELNDGELEFKLQEVHENDEGECSEREEWTVDFKTLKSGWWTNKNREEPDLFNIENTLINYVKLLED